MGPEKHNLSTPRQPGPDQSWLRLVGRYRHSMVAASVVPSFDRQVALWGQCAGEIMSQRPHPSIPVAALASVVLIGSLLGGNQFGAGFAPAPALAAGPNPITIENQQPGSTGWHFEETAQGVSLKATNH